jgi:prepilin peptidase CpaA
MLEAALLTIFPALMAYAAASDLFTMTIPNKLSLVLITAFLAFALIAGLPWNVVLMHIGAGVSMLIVCFSLFAAGWIGGGDAKLAAATALWLGFGTLLDYLILSTIGGGLLTLAILYMRGVQLPLFTLGWRWLQRLHDRNTGIPYGIALAGAALFVYPHSPIWLAVLAA